MIRTILPAALAAMASCAAFAQPAVAPLSFEVASVKPAPPPTDGRMRVMMGGDPGRVNYSNVSLRDIIRNAYRLKDYQISGPAWINTERYDVVAKLPADASRDQVPEMLQALLAERFKLTVHREAKDLPAFALVVGKNGLKMKESVIEDSPAGGDPKTAGGPKFGDFPAPPPPPPGGGGAVGGFAIGGGGRGGRGGPDGMPMFQGRGPMMMMNGRGHLVAKQMSTTGLADMLTRQLDRPVLDETGLKATYDFTLDWTPDGSEAGPRLLGPPGGGHGGGDGGAAAGGGGDGRAPTTENPDGSGPPLAMALQQQLGLRMEAKKLPLELLVIDRCEKVPTEN
jgi:uncharacterized protein (TIGR03435 family)